MRFFVFVYLYYYFSNVDLFLHSFPEKSRLTWSEVPHRQVLWTGHKTALSDFPLPPPVVLVHLNPVTVWLDVLTLVWSNAFMLNLMKSVQSLQVQCPGKIVFSPVFSVFYNLSLANIGLLIVKYAFTNYCEGSYIIAVDFRCKQRSATQNTK